MKREETYRIIDEEREHQDRKWKDLENVTSNVSSIILFMEHHLLRAREAAATGDERTGQEACIRAMDEIRKVAALAVYAGEVHGMPSRKLPQMPQKKLDDCQIPKEENTKLDEVKDKFGLIDRKDLFNLAISLIDGVANNIDKGKVPSLREIKDKGGARLVYNCYEHIRKNMKGDTPQDLSDTDNRDDERPEFDIRVGDEIISSERLFYNLRDKSLVGFIDSKTNCIAEYKISNGEVYDTLTKVRVGEVIAGNEPECEAEDNDMMKKDHSDHS